MRGHQRPRVESRPGQVASSAGREAVDLARAAGLVLDPWQEHVLEHSLGERADGKWAAFEVGLIVSRQNGKGSILEARELAGLFLLGEKLIVHSAHEFSTSLEALNRLEALIKGTPEFEKRLKRVSRAHGEEGIELKTGQRVRFRTRTKSGGRGLSADCVVLDEAMILPETAVGALMPTLSARPNPQIWYTGSAVDQQVHDHGLVLTRLRNRGIAGDDERLAFFEWSADGDIADAARIADDRDAWQQANPALGYRIDPEFVAMERRSMDLRTFATERLGVGDYPQLDRDDGDAIRLEAWDALADEASSIDGPLVLAFDIRPDRGAGAIAAAGKRPTDGRHVEVIEHRSGTGWIASRLKDLTGRHRVRKIVLAGRSPAAALVADLKDLHLGVPIEELSTSEEADAYGQLHDAVSQGTVHHLGTEEVRAALRGAKRRPVGDAHVWSRKSSAVDISPLVAVTLAHSAASTLSRSVYETRGLATV